MRTRCLIPEGGVAYGFYDGNAEYTTGYFNGGEVDNFQCGNEKHTKPNANTIPVSGANTAAKTAVCCDDDVAGMCSGNTLVDESNGLGMSSANGGQGCPTSDFSCTWQFRCASHSQLKSTSATTALSGATAAERNAVCCDTTTPANAASFDNCSTITTRATTGTSLAPAGTFCGDGKEYDATKAESTCAAGQCNQNTAADVTTCCKTTILCANTDGTSANTAQCQVRTHSYILCLYTRSKHLQTNSNISPIILQ